MFREFLESPTALLANNPVMILRGEAGIGKSHLLADIAQKRSKNSVPVILLLGQHFTDDQNPWTQILRNQLRLDMNEDEFLGALNAKAQSTGSRILLMIDAINEGRGRFFWNNYIKGFIRTIQKYKWIGLVISLRTSYEALVTPSDIVTDDLALRVTHHGFTDVEYEASKLFFDNYCIQQPSVPLLHPEFQNPLFLKLFCEGLYKSGMRTVPEGFEGISTILDFYITSINRRLCEPSKCDYSPNINLVKKAILTIIDAKLKINFQYVPYEQAHQLISDVAKQHTEKWRHFLDNLINEGILTQNLFFDKNDYVNGVYFAYERFDDHLTVSYLLEEYLNVEDPKSSFQEGQLLHDFIKNETSCYRNKGYIEALSIQLPETIGLELYEVAPTCKAYYPIIEAFISGLLWRKTETISDKILPYVNEFVFNYNGTYDHFWDTFLQVSSNPKHFFSAQRLHNYLMEFTLATRDSEWTPYISNNYSGYSTIKRLIDWAWTQEDRSYISDESIKLSSITLAWFLSSPNRKLRDHATKALVCLLKDRIKVLIQVLQLFEEVNDPYVYERLFAVSYGCALRTQDKKCLYDLSYYVYESIFNKEKVYPHVLLRDYARGIIEYAVYLGLNNDEIDLKKIRPPYKSEWYNHIPDIEEINKYNYDYKSKDFKKYYYAQNTIISSMTTEYGRGVGGYGDFGRYVFQSAVSNWEKWFDPQVLSNIATKRVFDIGYDIELHGEYDTLHTGRYDRHEHSNERIGKKYQWIAFHELLAKLSDHYPMSERVWGANDSIDGGEFALAEWINDLEFEHESHSVEKEERYDVDSAEFKKATTQKKYKLIPFHGPWNPFVRDIDPTNLFTTHQIKDKNYYEDIYQLPESNVNDWGHDFKSIPALEEIFFLTKRENREFTLLSSHIKWSRQNSEEEFRSRDELFIKTTALLVPKESVKYFSRHRSVHDYSYHQHWESEYRINSYEYYWHPSYFDCKTEEDLSVEEIKTTTLQYSWEKGYDKSIEGSVGYLIPSEYLVEQMELIQDREGYWINKEGLVTAYDIAVEGYNTGLIIDKSTIDNFLNHRSLAIIWDVFISKVANEELHEWRLVASQNDGQIIVEHLYDEDSWQLQN
jgi:hypothetical protein